MGPSLSLERVNLFMENFEKKALASFPFKPKWWVRFVDDISVNWSHDKYKLEIFVEQLNGLWK